MKKLLCLTQSPFLAIKNPLLTSIFIIAILMGMSSNSYGIQDWKQGSGTAPVEGTSNVSDLDTNISNYAIDPLDRTLFTVYKCTLTRTSATIITISAGKVICGNGAGTIHRMRENTSTTTVTMSNVGVGGIDSGSSEKVSTWYDIYAVADADATTFTAIATEQGVALADATYYRYIGSVYNDSGSDLKNFYWSGWEHQPLVMWDVPVSITTTISAGAWSGATSCASAIPSSSTVGIFGLSSNETGAIGVGIWIRPNGSTWSTGTANGIYSEVGSASSSHIGGQRIVATNSSQQIQYYNDSGDDTTAVTVEGFYLSR